MLSPELVKKFIEINKNTKGFDRYSDEEKEEIANSVARYYITLFKIHQRIKNDEKKSCQFQKDKLI